MPAEWLDLVDTAAGALVGAVATDGWTMTKAGFVRLFSRGERDAADDAERMLDHTRQDLAMRTGEELVIVRGEHEAQWRGRLARLLEHHPQAADELQTLVATIGAGPRTHVQARDGALAAARDIHIQATDDSQAAGIVYRGMTKSNPPQPGTASA